MSLDRDQHAWPWLFSDPCIWLGIFENSKWDPSQNGWAPEEETNRICVV